GPADEFGRLKTAFNGMLGRLESAFESRQRFASDASHELRTPLAVMQASADNVLASPRPPKQARDLAEEVQRQVARSDSLMESLLTLSRADDVTNTRERVDLADIAARVVTEKEPRATAAGIRLDLDVEDAPVWADPILMERMIANLIENAVRYNVESDGWVTCTVRTVEGAAQIEVANSGPTVAPADVEALFERFRRGAQRSEVSGHGLGLPIVSRVADVHGGTVVASPGAEGGLIVTVTIPGVA
ncbi:MAG: HAMP domain-containing histidine kinase, partial [Demequinaceae bacterium]|nr:HAMP domain-containing histidine kinase [Demequinaceae bacterium]